MLRHREFDWNLTGASAGRGDEPVRVRGLRRSRVCEASILRNPSGDREYAFGRAPASERPDLRKLREFLGARKHEVHLATEDDLRRDFPEFELRAVPPVGGGRRDPVIVDNRLSGRESLVLEAGSHEESVRMAADDLVRVAGAQLADICED